LVCFNLTFYPQLKLRAIFFRACGARTFDSTAFLLGFPAVHFSIARLAAKI
jgi:hypothetical protein